MHVPSSLPPISLRSSPPRFPPPPTKKNHTHTTGTSATTVLIQNDHIALAPNLNIQSNISLRLEHLILTRRLISWCCKYICIHLSWNCCTVWTADTPGTMCWFHEFHSRTDVLISRCCTDAADGDFPATARPWSFQKTQGPTGQPKQRYWLNWLVASCYKYIHIVYICI